MGNWISFVRERNFKDSGLFRPKSQFRRQRMVAGRVRSHLLGWLRAGCGHVPPSRSSATRGRRPAAPARPASPALTSSGLQQAQQQGDPPPDPRQAGSSAASRAPPGPTSPSLPAQRPAGCGGRQPMGGRAAGPGRGPAGAFPRAVRPLRATWPPGPRATPAPRPMVAPQGLHCALFSPTPGAGRGGDGGGVEPGISKSVYGGREGKGNCLLPITAVRNSNMGLSNRTKGSVQSQFNNTASDTIGGV